MPDDVSSHIKSVHYIYTKNIIVICYKSGLRYAYDMVTLYDFLDYLAKAEQKKSFGKGIYQFLNLMRKPRLLADSELEDYK